METKRIYIIGAGYGGIKALSKLCALGDMKIYLIDKNSYHYLQTDVYDYLAGKSGLADVAVDLYTFCASFNHNVTFIRQEVLRIDFKNKKITTSEGRHTYDYLILSTGAQTMVLDSIEGLKDNFHGIKSLEHALKFKQKFEYNIFNKIQNEGKCSRESKFNIIIAGGGLSGVEIASEMAYFAKQFYKETAYLCSTVDITLINSTKNPLASNSTFMQKQASSRLKKLGVKIITDSHVTKVEHDGVILNHTTKINMDFLIWTAGIMPSKLVQTLDIQKSKKGQILVDSYYRLLDYKEVFAIGDNAQLFNPTNNEPLPPTAQTAELAGSYVALNITHELLDKNLEIKDIRLGGFLASLGGNFAAAELFKSIKLTGKTAYFLKKIVEKMYKYPLQKRCKKGYKKIMSKE